MRMKLIRKLKSHWTNLRMKLVQEPEWVTIFDSRDEYIVRIKHMQLTEAEVPAVIFDQRDSSYQNFGYIYLKVHREHLEQANEILKLTHE
mmetsp:Transcript_24100/g.32315  ORF Transcript_24100/g.32315 Transcript_24100/m.32315 type:complete len:90 (-) Transcript_24100:95-364(-)